MVVRTWDSGELLGTLLFGPSLRHLVNNSSVVDITRTLRLLLGDWFLSSRTAWVVGRKGDLNSLRVDRVASGKRVFLCKVLRCCRVTFLSA